MVCHVDYCLAIGGKKIRTILLTVCLGLPAFVASLSMLFLDNLRGSLICNGREEILTLNSDLFENVYDGGEMIKLPLHHPYRILAIILGISNNK